MPEASWSVAKHDTVPLVDFALTLLNTHVYLTAFLASEGEVLEPPYGSVRDHIAQTIKEQSDRERPGQAPRSDVSDQRIRTWRSLFESLGFFLVEPETHAIWLTPLGHAIVRMHEALDDQILGANNRVAELASHVLVRHLLSNPMDAGEYPPDSDLHPYRFIWRAMRQLDDKLHWEEMNRVIFKIMYQRHEDHAIEHIRTIRKSCNSIYDSEAVEQLGTPTVVEGDETKRRITPWFSIAGFGGLLISAESDDQGFRQLSRNYIDIIDNALKEEIVVPAVARLSTDGYIKYVTSSSNLVEPIQSGTDAENVARVVTAAERYGSHKIICLVGIPGTGKSRLAKMAAMRLVDNDLYRYSEIQFHENTSYDDFVEGFVPRPSGEGFELRSKVFRQINRKARTDPEDGRFVLLIEEFTRANIHAVLGELITYIEHRNRPFRLAISQEEERIAPNLVVLATMNPRDKSVLVLDDAIRRRLHFIPINSSSSTLEQMLASKIGGVPLGRLVEWFESNRLTLPFGHGVFSDVRSEDDLREVWRGGLVYFLQDALGLIREQNRTAAESYPWP